MRLVSGLLLVGIVVALAGCGGASRTENAETAKKVEQAVAKAPTKSMLLEFETKAIEALKMKDAAFWESYLDDKFVGFGGGERIDKAATGKMFGTMTCEIASYSFADEKMVPVGNDAIILTLKTTIDGTCAGRKIPSPSTTATLYVRAADTWKATYHNEVTIRDPKSGPPASKPGTQKSPEAKSTAPAAEPDALTSTLFGIERRVWAEWKAKNRSQLAGLVTEDASRVDRNGSLFVGKQAVVNMWVVPKCDFKSAEPSQPAASEISPVIAILTYRGTMSGTCNEKPLADFWGTTIYQKDGGEWKAVYIFETPV